MERCSASILRTPSQPNCWRRSRRSRATEIRSRAPTGAGVTWNPFAIYQPASSAVGMYQLTDAASRHAAALLHSSAHRFEEGCRFSGYYSRTVPSHATELTAVLLDRNVTAILANKRDVRASPQQEQDLAAVIHLCGSGPARAFRAPRLSSVGRRAVRRPVVAKYLADVNAIKRQFLRLAAIQRSPAQEVIRK